MTAPLLALETSGNSLGVALISGSGLLFEENVTEGMIHGRALAPLMKRAMHEHNLKPAQLGALAVSMGPGSWTGLRIGISAAKTFAWAAEIPLVCVPSFEALALEAFEQKKMPVVITLRDARSEGFFAAIFDVTGGAPRRLLEECVLRPADFIDAAQQLTGRAQISVCGDEKCLKLIAAEIAANGWTACPELQHIPARAVAQRAWSRMQSGDGVLKTPAELHKLSPLYLRASDPELKLKPQPAIQCLP